MSEWITISFKDIQKDSLMDYCIELGKRIMESADELIKENIYYIPSIRLNISEDMEKDYRVNWREADRNWLYKLFSVNIIYWEKYELLGIVGEIPKGIKETLTTIDFQNSSDQDYDYDYWHGVHFFEDVLEKLEHADINTIFSYLNKNGNDRYDITDIEENPDYYGKLAVYDTIYNALDIHKWLWTKEGDFKTFSLQSINSSEEFFSLSMKLESIRKACVVDLEQS